jgi:hypothetical protein
MALLVVVAFALVAGAALVGRPAATLMAAPDERDGYPHLMGQEHVGNRCTPEDTALAGGTIIGVGGQVVAGGGGTGVGSDTFWAYELRTGEPSPRQPFAEPAIYVNPGGASPAE